MKKFKSEKRKGIFPYEWLDSVHKLNETSLPPREALYSKFKQIGNTDKEYQQALDCWIKMRCESI